MHYVYGIINLLVFIGSCYAVEKTFPIAYNRHKLSMRLLGISVGLFGLSICGYVLGIPIIIFRPPLAADLAGKLCAQGGLIFLALFILAFAVSKYTKRNSAI